MDNIKKLKRTARLVSVLTKYGFDTLAADTGLKRLIPDSYIQKSEKRKELFSLSVYERIRMALEELGPAYVKLGQLMSSRDDILPEELTVELQKLQDNVPPEDINIYDRVKDELGIEPAAVFKTIDAVPIAAASLSQVYTAVLKDGGQKVIIKVKRKGIRRIIEADILIMRDFSVLLEKYYEAARSIGLVNIVNTFDKAITGELSFTQELADMERFRNNFRDDDTIYVPYTYKDLSNSDMLCMEFIDGIKVSKKEELLSAGLQTKDVAEKVVNSYMKQVMDFGFFHADPHSGNIFVLKDGRIVFIDYGSMGRMFPKDREDIGDFVLAALRKDTKRLLYIIKRIAVRYRIPNEAYLERELYEFLDILDSHSIKELDLGSLVKRFSRLLNENKIILPDYIYLLVRGIVLLEGIGRELGLETDIIDNIKPYGLKLIEQRLDPKYIAGKVIDKAYDLGEKLGSLPGGISSLIQKVNNNQLEVGHTVHGLADIKNTINRLVVAILVFALAIGSSLLILAQMPPLAWGVSVLGFLGFMGAGVMAVILIIIILRNKKTPE